MEKQIEPSHNQRLKSFESFDALVGPSSPPTSIIVSGWTLFRPGGGGGGVPGAVVSVSVIVQGVGEPDFEAVKSR